MSEIVTVEPPQDRAVTLEEARQQLRLDGHDEDLLLGAKLEALDLRECGMVMEVKGEPISVGAGIACLGSPITASLWLARVMARVGRPLLEGDVILSGALGPMAGIARGDVVEARINGVGTVRAAFAGEAG